MCIKRLSSHSSSNIEPMTQILCAPFTHKRIIICFWSALHQSASAANRNRHNDPVESAFSWNSLLSWSVMSHITTLWGDSTVNVLLHYLNESLLRTGEMERQELWWFLNESPLLIYPLLNNAKNISVRGGALTLRLKSCNFKVSPFQLFKYHSCNNIFPSPGHLAR